MVKHLPPRGVHAYQTTVVPRSDQQIASATQKRYQYPWAENVHTPAYQVPATDSSTSDNAYHVPQYYGGPIREGGPPSPLYQAPYDAGTWRSYKHLKHPTGLEPNAYVFPQCTSAFSLPLCNETQTRCQSPVASVSPELPIGACGGHCPAFEYVCYYVLQVLFVVGVLTGISLCIAGIVLRRTNRNGDLGVLVYIGCLASCVCGLLLGVQGCARRQLRKRKMRMHTHIPMHPIQEPPTATPCPYTSSTLPHSQVYRPTTNVYQEEEEISGVPWWRRTAN